MFLCSYVLMFSRCSDAQSIIVILILYIESWCLLTHSRMRKSLLQFSLVYIEKEKDKRFQLNESRMWYNQRVLSHYHLAWYWERESWRVCTIILLLARGWLKMAPNSSLRNKKKLDELDEISDSSVRTLNEMGNIFILRVSVSLSIYLIDKRRE